MRQLAVLPITAGLTLATTLLVSPPAWSSDAEPATSAANVESLFPSAQPRSCPPDGKRTKYKIGKARNTYKATNIKSDWLKGPGTISYSKNRTATVGGSVTGSLKFEQSAIFASAEQSISITATGSWAWGHIWQYELKVPKGKTARMVMYHQMKRFPVTKYRWHPGKCTYVKAGSGTALGAAKDRTANVWKLQYQ